jgi:hypothetical protein
MIMTDYVTLPGSAVDFDISAMFIDAPEPVSDIFLPTLIYPK